MTTLDLGSKTWVLLNTPRVCGEIIAKRSNTTHERPLMPIASDLISRGKRGVVRPTAEWAEGRRVQHHLLNGSALRTYQEWQEEESLRMLKDYLDRPGDWYRHHYRYANCIMHRIVLGEGAVEKETEELEKLLRVTTEFLVNTNYHWIDFFPLLARLPRWVQFWKGPMQRMGRVHYETFSRWWEPVKRAVEEGAAGPSFARDVLLSKDTEYGGDDDDAMYLAISTISAGSDNTRLPLNTFMMAALCYPDAMRKARKEIDAICGGLAKRLPRISDMAQLPYICALIKEVLRWRPVVPLIPQHVSTQDLEFEGYRIPAGTEFLINIFPVSNAVEDPEAFKPERWLDGHEGRITHNMWGFGGGRRICVGYRLAQTQLFVAFSRLIYCFDYSAAGEINSMGLGHGTTTEPFPVQVTIRSKEHEQLIMREAS
ncbi:MAG: hypothetical protein Q9217_001970 [Psora testacea]